MEQPLLEESRFGAWMLMREQSQLNLNTRDKTALKLRDNINDKTEITGVGAYINPDGNLVINNRTGKNINIRWRIGFKCIEYYVNRISRRDRDVENC